MRDFVNSFCRRIKGWADLTVAVAAVLVVLLVAEGAWAEGAIASPLTSTQPVVAYNIDFGMDIARIEQTIEHYGEEIREVVEQALMNNVNHPESKDTAENTYQRKTALNDLLPERRSSAFSTDDLIDLKKTEHPRDRLR